MKPEPRTGAPDPRMHAHRRDRADDWVIAPSGQRFWGLNGAAGLLAHDPGRGVLLQHRAEWSHHGGTWGLPGGARHMGESAFEGALREASEEAAVPRDSLVPRAAYVLDLEVWSYTTVVATVTRPFEPRIGDAESLALAWVPVEEVAALDLHPGLAATWPILTRVLAHRPVVVVDVANVVGARADGWWRDRQGATERFLERLESRRERGLPGSELGSEATVAMPQVVAVVEGVARGARPSGDVEVVDADADGDTRVVEEALRLVSEGCEVTVVTSDRGLRDRLPTEVATRGAGWLRTLVGD